MITENQKRIYNLHMLTYRKKTNLPYKFRQNFDNYEKENEKDYLALIKLESLLNTYTNINIKKYFESPYEIYKDEKYFNLEFYTKQKAIKAYTTYLKLLKEQSPDTQEQLEFIKDSLLYIKTFCVENNLTISQYLKHRKQTSLTWMTDVAQNNISVYVIIGLSYFNIFLENIIEDTPNDECEMLIGNLHTNYINLKMKLSNSKYAKDLIIKGIKLINNILKNNNIVVR